MSRCCAVGGTPGAAENRPLTAIRGIASLWVVGHHWLPSASRHLRAIFDPGFLAVDLFFILSGLILARVHAQLTRAELPDFYLRRVFRLYPLHLVCLAWLVGIVAPSLVGVDWLTLGASAALIHPFLDVAPLANPPSWSIGVELGCYLAFPLLLACLRRLDGRAVSAVMVLALLWIEWRIQFHLLGATHGAKAMERGLCGFTLGMAITLWSAPLERWPHAGLLAGTLELVGIVGVVWSIRSLNWALVPPCCSLLLVGLGFDRGLVARALRAQPWVWLGRISFSIYLAHYPLLLCAQRVMSPTRFGEQGQWLWYAGLLVALLALSTLLWRYIEEPGRSLPRRLRRRRSHPPRVSQAAS